MFIHGSGSFGASTLGEVTASCNLALNVSLRTRILDEEQLLRRNAIPKRALDAILEGKTIPTQAAFFQFVA